MSVEIVEKNTDETTTAINLIDDVSKNLETLKKLVGLKKSKVVKKPKKTDGETSDEKSKSEKLPKYVYMKEGVWYRKNVHESVKTNLKKYILEKMIH